MTPPVHALIIGDYHLKKANQMALEPTARPYPIEITEDMVKQGAKVFHKWEDSDEPDARVYVRKLLSAILGERATFCSPSETRER